MIIRHSNSISIVGRWQDRKYRTYQLFRIRVKPPRDEGIHQSGAKPIPVNHETTFHIPCKVRSFDQDLVRSFLQINQQNDRIITLFSRDQCQPTVLECIHWFKTLDAIGCAKCGHYFGIVLLDIKYGQSIATSKKNAILVDEYGFRWYIDSAWCPAYGYQIGLATAIDEILVAFGRYGRNPAGFFHVKWKRYASCCWVEMPPSDDALWKGNEG